MTKFSGDAKFYHSLKQQGFTLVELSIVIIIVGLIIAGISAGTALIETARLNAIINSQSGLQTSTMTFRMRYQTLPGDFNAASSFWPSANCVAGDTNLDVTKCDGNYDGKLEGPTSSAEYRAEGTRFFQHLANAGMIAGSSSYVGGAGDFVIGVNAFPSAIDGAGFYARYGFGNVEGLNYQDNFLILSRADAIGVAGISPLTPEQA